MGRGKKKPILQDALDATPERLKQAANEGQDPWEFVDPSRIDSIQPIGLVRRFRATHLDRWYKRDKPEKSLLTYRQYAAGDWYRNTHARSGFTMCIAASYGERVSGGEPAYGMARTERQAEARRQWREARNQMPRQSVGFVDRMLLHDEMPRYGRPPAPMLRMVREALDALGDYLKMPQPDRS